jgi:hypothetical protein
MRQIGKARLKDTKNTVDGVHFVSFVAFTGGVLAVLRP